MNGTKSHPVLQLRVRSFGNSGELLASMFKIWKEGIDMVFWDSMTFMRTILEAYLLKRNHSAGMGLRRKC
jgi:hypothetical protein